MKKIYLLFICMILVVMITIFLPVSAQADAGGYVIKDYDVKTVVSESNVYDVTETITVDFSEGRHGIYRNIPVNRELTRTGTDGKIYKTQVMSSVSDVFVEGYSYAVEYYPDEVDIRIGDSDRTVTGRQVYKIRYKLAFGDDGVDTFDEAYYNILGTKWATTTDHLTFAVTLPKPFDPKNLGFSTGAQGQTGYDPHILHFHVDGSTISGEVSEQIPSYEGVTMRLELPQGYFKIPDVRIPEWILMGIIGFITIAAFLLYLIFGRSKRPVKTVEFEPPEGMTPPELAYAYRGNISSRDVVSLLVYWADKGYLKITQEGKSVRLEKLKNMYEGADYERLMFDSLFWLKPTAGVNDLKYQLIGTIQTVKTRIKAAYQSESTRLFPERGKGINNLLYALLGLPIWITLSCALSGFQLGLGFAIPMGFTMSLPFYTAYIFILMLLKNWNNLKPIRRVVSLCVLLLITAGMFAIFLIIYMPSVHEPLFPISTIVSNAIIILCSAFIRKRTPRGVELLGKILGFKDYIVHAEEDRLKMLVEKDPQYFYHILPYAYVLNVTDKWIKNFEQIAVIPPDWYAGYDTAFSTALFVTSFQSAMSTITSHISSTSYSSGDSSGSGFSGGSSSGGGGGGGGGGSW